MEEIEQINTSTRLSAIEKDIEEIKARNKRVEGDKAWETSLTRKIIIAVLTYVVIVIFFYLFVLGNPFINAIVPTVGFLLSTFSMPLFKKLWLKNKK